MRANPSFYVFVFDISLLHFFLSLSSAVFNINVIHLVGEYHRLKKSCV